MDPDLIHCNDWMTGLIPAAARRLGIPSLFTVHNIHTHDLTLAQIEDRGIDAAEFWPLLYYKRPPMNYEESRSGNLVDSLASGIFAAPFINTVSPTFLVEIVRGYRGGLYGFFSGHACNTMCMATFLSWLFRYRNVTITLVFWSLSTTFTRIYLGVHHLGDILVGFTIGVILGTLFYFLMSYLMKRFGKSGKMISSSFTPTGYLVDDMHVLLTVIFANYILVTVFAMFLSF